MAGAGFLLFISSLKMGHLLVKQQPFDTIADRFDFGMFHLLLRKGSKNLIISKLKLLLCTSTRV